MASELTNIERQHSSQWPATTSTDSTIWGDTEALNLWLSIFELKSKETARHYRTQSGKFRLFLRLLHPDWENNTHIQRATEQDVAYYELALALKPLPDGKPLDLTLTDSQMNHFDLDVQPYQNKLKKSSINQALSVLNALYEYLRTPNGSMTTPYVVVNPVKRVRKMTTRTVKQTERHIPLDGMQAMNAYLHNAIARAFAVGDKAATARYERKLWIFTLLFGLWGRREEIVKLTMGSFRQQHDEAWKATLTRKGGKEEDVPVPVWVIAGLRRYRTSIGFTSSWPSGDPTPAVLSVRVMGMGNKLASSIQASRHIGAQMLYLEVKDIAQKVAAEIADGTLLPEITAQRRSMLAECLARCSPHWFRHTGPTIAINSGVISVENASKMLGHSSLATTTQMYYHADEDKTRFGLDALGALL